MPPTSTWGTRFATAPLVSQMHGDRFRILASADDTTVTINGETVATLDRGQFHEQLIEGPSSIVADHPVLVAQFSNSAVFADCPEFRCDPFMMLIPPYEQFLASYTVTTPASGYRDNYINVVVPQAGASGLRLDGKPIPVGSFGAVGDSGFVYAQLTVAKGTHVVEGTRPFGAFVYGYDSFDSYGYPGGLSLAPVAEAKSLDLTPATAEHPVGTVGCVTATVTDANGGGLRDIRVDFEITGANAHNAFATTDERGEAKHCYTGEHAGEDTIRAAVGAVNATATATWTPQGNRPPTAQAAAAATDEDTATTIPLQGSDPDGDPISYAIVTGPSHGSLGPVSAAGSVPYTPAADYHGSDSFTFRTNDGAMESEPATVSITVRPVNDPPTAADRSLSTDENAAAGLELTAGDPDGDALRYTVVSGPAHGTLSGTPPQLTYTPDHDYVGPDSFTFKAGDGALDSNVAMVSITVRQVKHDTSTTYSGDGTVQYSDAAGLSARLLDVTADPAVPVAGRLIGFTLGTQSATAGPTSAAGVASTSLKVTQTPGTVAAVTAAFAGDAGYHASGDTRALSITKEDCTLTYTGALTILPLADTVLAADLGEPDTSLGDRTGKLVTFTVTDSAGGQQTFTATTDANGRAQTSVALLADVYTVGAQFAGDDYYRGCGTAMDAVVTVATAQNKVTGGGWISIGTGRTNFGLNLIPHAGGMYTSQFQLVSNNNKSRFHASGSVTVSATSSTSATWSGTGAWNKQTGYRYTVTVVDNGSSGKKGDTVNIKITSPANSTVYTTDGSQTLKGGNLTVHR
jgi:IgGFc binding protein/Bacterial Ig domain/Bacterial Ig-like domain (group 1)